MNERGKIKSFSVLKTAKIGAIVTAVSVAIPIALFLAVFTLLRFTHHSTRGTVAAPSAVVQPSTVATPNTIGQENQLAQNKHPRPLRLRDALVMLVVGPLIYGVFGFLLFALWSWLYNVLSPRFGGIEIELTDSNVQ